MERAEVIRMAKEAKAEVTTAFNYHSADDMFIFFDIEVLERFANQIEAKVAKAERERCASILEGADQDYLSAYEAAEFIRALD